MSERTNPFSDIDRLFESMSEQFEAAARDWRSGNPMATWSGSGERMALDLVEHDAEFVATVDLPGFQHEDIDLQVTDNMLRITAEREETHDEAADQFIRHERSHATARRLVRLPEPVDTESVSATMENGVLTITLPKTEVETTRTIEIS